MGCCFPRDVGPANSEVVFLRIKLVGGFNPFENISPNGNLPQIGVKPPPSKVFWPKSCMYIRSYPTILLPELPGFIDR